MSLLGLFTITAAGLIGPAHAHTPTTATSDCTRVRDHLDDLRQTGATRALCTEPANAAEYAHIAGTPLNEEQATAVPDKCLGQLPPETWVIDRFTGCHQAVTHLRVIELGTGRQIGEVYIRVVNSVEVDARSLQWTHKIATYKLDGRGDINGVIVESAPECVVNCSISTHNELFGLLLDEPQGDITVQANVDPGSSTLLAVQTKWTVVYTQMGAVSSGPAEYSSETVRCDTQTPNATPGCVLPRFISTLHYTTARNGELATHIRDAQARPGMAGSPTSGMPLTRQTEAEKIRKNRDKACPSSFPKPVGTECDEYPFASTDQGAALGNGIYSVRAILADDNQLGGRELSAFYRTHRIVNGEAFYVQID